MFYFKYRGWANENKTSLISHIHQPLKKICRIRRFLFRDGTLCAFSQSCNFNPLVRVIFTPNILNGMGDQLYLISKVIEISFQRFLVFEYESVVFEKIRLEVREKQLLTEILLMTSFSEQKSQSLSL